MALPDLTKLSTKELKALLEVKKSELRQLKKEEPEFTVDEARDLIDKLFSVWKDGGKFINKTIADGKANCYVISPIGRVRHLWGYLHASPTAHGQMNRRGPNSVIQGVSSDMGFCGARQIQHIVWRYFASRGINFSLKQSNSVHDATESIMHIVDLPMGLYIQEHALTTLVHRKYRKVFDFPITMDLEIEAEIGGSSAVLQKWDGRYDVLPDLAAQSIDWMKENLGYDLNKGKLVDLVNYNARIIKPFRDKELRIRRKQKTTAETMLITRKNVLDLGLEFGCNY